MKLLAVLAKWLGAFVSIIHYIWQKLRSFFEQFLEWRIQSLARRFLTYFLFFALTGGSLFLSSPLQPALTESMGISAILFNLGVIFIASLIGVISESSNSEDHVYQRLSSLLQKITNDLGHRAAAQTFILTVSWYKEKRHAFQRGMAILLGASICALQLDQVDAFFAFSSLAALLWLNLFLTAYRINRGYFGTNGPEALELLEFIHAQRHDISNGGGRWTKVGISIRPDSYLAQGAAHDVCAPSAGATTNG